MKSKIRIWLKDKVTKLNDELSSPDTRKYFGLNLSLANADSHVSLKGMLGGKKFIGSSRISLGSDMSHIPTFVTD